MSEEWRPVAGYEGFYEVSDRGRVRRIASGKGTWMGRVLRPVLHNRGYLEVVLCQNGNPRTTYIHQLVAEAFLGRRPDGKEINHKDGDKANNSIGNLEYVTPTENRHHAMANGKYRRGESSSLAKLTAKQVQRIRSLYATGLYSQAFLAQQYGVSRSCIQLITSGRNWARP